MYIAMFIFQKVYIADYINGIMKILMRVWEELNIKSSRLGLVMTEGRGRLL